MVLSIFFYGIIYRNYFSLYFLLHCLSGILLLIAGIPNLGRGLIGRFRSEKGLI